jgi:hypothetical protein
LRVIPRGGARSVARRARAGPSLHTSGNLIRIEGRAQKPFLDLPNTLQVGEVPEQLSLLTIVFDDFGVADAHHNLETSCPITSSCCSTEGLSHRLRAKCAAALVGPLLPCNRLEEPAGLRDFALEWNGTAAPSEAAARSRLPRSRRPSRRDGASWPQVKNEEGTAQQDERSLPQSRPAITGSLE